MSRVGPPPSWVETRRRPTARWCPWWSSPRSQAGGRTRARWGWTSSHRGRSHCTGSRWCDAWNSERDQGEGGHHYTQDDHTVQVMDGEITKMKKWCFFIVTLLFSTMFWCNAWNSEHEQHDGGHDGEDYAVMVVVGATRWRRLRCNGSCWCYTWNALTDWW